MVERNDEYPDTEKEILEAHICGCGTVARMIDQAAGIVRHMSKGHGHSCVIWNMQLVDLIHQFYVNHIIQVQVNNGEEPDVAVPKVMAMHKQLSDDVMKMMNVAEDHVGNVIRSISEEEVYTDPSHLH